MTTLTNLKVTANLCRKLPQSRLALRLLAPAVFSGALLLGALGSSPVQAADVVLDEIIAVVNEGVVLRSEVSAETLFLNLQAKASGQTLPQNDVLRERVLERLISQEIQRQRASQLGIDVDQASVNDAIDRIAAGNQMKTAEFRQTLQREGFDYTYYRRTVQHEILFSRLVRREVEQTINVSDQEIDDFLAGTSPTAAENLVYRLRHILIAVPESDTDSKIAAARARMDAIVSQLASGADFSSLAAAESDGRHALKGGDLGWRQLKELPRFLHEVVQATEQGNVSAVVQSPDGFHVIKIDDQQTRTPPEVNETRVRHIFIADSVDGNSGTARQTLVELRERITKGEAFGQLAAEFSEDPNSANGNGELPWALEGDLPTEMEKQAAALTPGDVSAPFKTRFGWHIMEVLERRTANANNTQQRRESELILRQRKIEQETERWSRRLRDEAFVEVKS